jgi:hypothetical protein
MECSITPRLPAAKRPEWNETESIETARKRKEIMKYSFCVAGAALLVGLVGCATAPRVVVQEPVGPCHRVAAQGAANGSLRVVTARQSADVDVNAQTFFWNNDFGKNEFMLSPSHTGYTIYAADGSVLRRVRNARGESDERPERVALPAGTYTIEAQAETDSTGNMTVMVPVVIEAGQTTTVDLEPAAAQPAVSAELADVVRLSDGRVIGCRAQHLVGLNAP